MFLKVVIKMKIIYLKPKSYLLDTLPRSDTLFGAICWGVRTLYDEKNLKEILSKFSESNPPFLISSTFPFIDVNLKRIHLLPKPNTPVNIKPAQDLKEFQKLKEFKKISYLSSSIFTEFIQGKVTDKYLFDNFSTQEEFKENEGNVKEKYIKIGDALIETKLVQDLLEAVQISEPDKYEAIKIIFSKLTPFKKIDLLRNSIDRLSSGTIKGKLFYNEAIFLKENCGLYFLLNIFESNIEPKLLAVINFLSDRGIGKDINTGKGQFNVEIKDNFIPYEESPIPNTFTTLSLYYPRQDELQQFKENMLFYELVKRKGKIESSFVSFTDIWKDTVLMYKEGSVFPLLNGKQFYGENPIVKKIEFEVQQYGYAFPVKMEIKNE